MKDVACRFTKQNVHKSKMAEEAVRVSQPQTNPIKIKKWKIRQGTTVPVGRIILIYEEETADKSEQKKLKATQAGIIHKILAKEGNMVQPGEPLYEIKSCSHPTIMNDMCAECGADLRRDDNNKTIASVPMIHAIPELKVSEEQAQKLGKADNDRLIKDRKLVLLVDLDQTLIHTTNDNIPPNIKDVYHFQLYGPKSPWYHTRLRPGTHKFLNSICEFYELHICTFGARNYAHMIAMFLDPDQKFFSNRILSRDECFDPTSKKANLRALFPCGDDMVCIIDDREDVWSHALNLIHVKAYHFFQHTGDINAPPGLDKHENDDKEGVDLSKIINQNSKETACESKTEENDAEKKEECAVSSSSDAIKENLKTRSDEKPEEHSQKNSEEPEVKIKNISSDKGEASNSEENIQPDSSGREECEKNTDNETFTDESSENKIDSTDTTENIDNSVDTKEIDEVSKKTENNGKLKSVSNPLDSKEQTDDNLIEIEDPDDYLVYLEDILKRIHRTFYEKFDKMEAGKIPDLKNIIPTVRNNILQGCKLVFSGLVPTHYKLEQSKAYQVARSLGAEVQLDIDDETTHLVAVRPGTAKVNAGRRKKHLKIVTSDWLWCCAERWEHVDERIFPLSSKGSKNRHPPPHCSSPEHIPSYPEHDAPALRKRTPSGRFMDTINPLMSFSSDDIADMDKEVEDILDDESDDSDGDQNLAVQVDNEDDNDDTDIEEMNLKHLVQTEILNAYEKSHDDGERIEATELESEDEQDHDKNSKRKRDLDDDSQESQDLPSSKFRRGEDIDNELDIDSADPDDNNDSDSFGAPDESDGEWNMMGAALEREFLSD